MLGTVRCGVQHLHAGGTGVLMGGGEGFWEPSLALPPHLCCHFLGGY